MSEHGKTGKRGEDSTDAEVSVSVTELGYGRFLIGVVHEVDIALENFRLIGKSVLYGKAVLLVLLVLEHVHERGVVNTVHAQCSYEVSLEHPEGLSQQESVRHFLCDPVNDLTPEFLRDPPVEFLIAHCIDESSRNVSACTRLGVPKPLNMALCQGHCRIEADDREVPGNMKNFLNDSLTGSGIEIIELCSVVPGHRCTIITMENILGFTSSLIPAAECYRCIGPAEVVVLKLDLDVGIR